MRRDNPLAQARVQGALAAARQLRRLKVDQARAVDIFQIIVQSNMWLLFQPLEDLLGAYLPEGRGGILINTRRPRSVQRITAAHEYGHHVLQHQGSVDDEGDIGESPFAARRAEEAAAQAFALDFLMPPRLVNALCNDLGISGDLIPYHAYLLSLYMGTSYQATVYQLAALEKIPTQTAAEFLRITPKQIKQEIGRGLGPGNPWAEIWPLDEASTGQELSVNLEDEIRLALPESPSTGFIWVTETEGLPDLRDKPSLVESPPIQPKGVEEAQLDLHYTGPEHTAARYTVPDHPLALIRAEFEPVNRRFLAEGTGGRGSRYMTFRALRRGNCGLRLALRRPWQKQSAPVREFEIKLAVAGKPTGEAERGYLDEAKNVDLAFPRREA